MQYLVSVTAFFQFFSLPLPDWLLGSSWPLAAWSARHPFRKTSLFRTSFKHVLNLKCICTSHCLLHVLKVKHECFPELDLRAEGIGEWGWKGSSVAYGSWRECKRVLHSLGTAGNTFLFSYFCSPQRRMYCLQPCHQLPLPVLLSSSSLFSGSSLCTSLTWPHPFTQEDVITRGCSYTFLPISMLFLAVPASARFGFPSAEGSCC